MKSFRLAILISAIPLLAASPHPAAASSAAQAAASAAAPSAPASGASWALVSSAPVEARIQAEFDQLASQRQATLSTVKSVALAARLHPSLTLELVTAPNARAFQRSFRGARPQPGPETIRQAYVLNVAYDARRGRFEAKRVRITAVSPEGLHNALIRLSALLTSFASGSVGDRVPEPKSVMEEEGGRAGLLEIKDFPSFAARGVVEGFYGTPWSHQDRLDILRFEGEHGMNAYYYAPKDDPYHREHWRDPYPPDKLAELGELVQAARANFVDFCFAVSPGLSMTYSSDADFDALTAKLTSVGKLGTSCYALFLDDVPEELKQPADQARFKSLAAAHAYVINKLYHTLIAQSPANHLVVTPTTYTNGFGGRDYIRDLGAAVDPHVDLVWTGTEVVSPVITVPQTREWSKFLRRPPLVWDNYPVDDFRRWRPFLGPLVGRAPNLETVVRGLVSNPMNEAHASMLPLWTIADYLWNPLAYISRQAEQQALTALYGPGAPKLFAPILAAYGDYGWQESVFTPLFSPSRLPIDLPEMNRRLAAMDPAFQAMAGRPEFAQVASELAPFVQNTRQRALAMGADPAFKHLPDGTVQWDEDYGVLTAERVATPPTLDGDFAKWAAGKTYSLDPAPPRPGATPAPPPPVPFSGRYALGWDDRYLYLGVDLTQPE
ncbi:MAG TPA: protein O-GlcNAcase, partial [Terriglobia bacterium]|nr:protein O-GlcNAcase [Terriglobia bacterium]